MKHLARRHVFAEPPRGLRWGGVGLACLAAAWLVPANVARAIDLAQVPLFLSPAVNPNVLVMFDNSQSMDGTMAGKVLSGDSPETRSNVARGVLRDIIGSYRSSFNWGLGSFGISGTPGRYGTFGYYLGNEATMRYTNTCDNIVDGVGVSDIVGPHAVVVGGVKTIVVGPLPCIANPEVFNGFNFITFDRSGDDADVNDVTYGLEAPALCPPPLPQRYGVGSSTDADKYAVFGSRSTNPILTGVDWASRDFECSFSTLSFSATDSGWVANALESPRRLWISRGWGYDSAITGLGVINEPVVTSQADTDEQIVAEALHFAKLNALLAPEDDNPASPSLKNAARYTPLAGTIETGRKYFEGNGYTSPISATCQRNIVVLATDGNPTGKKDGSQYSPTEWVNTFDPATGLWTYGPAIVGVLDEITALRTTAYNGQTYDIQTYVIGMGDTVNNPSSIAALNAMADKGGTGSAFLASNAEGLATAFQTLASDLQAKVSASSAVGVSAGSWQTGAALYQAKFSSLDWSGDLLAFAVGSDGRLAATPTWEAGAQLKLQFWDAGRAIMTYKPSALVGARGVPFRWPADPAAPTATDLDAAQILALNTSAAGVNDDYGALRLRYLRGDVTQEVRNCGNCTPKFRNRPTTVLGDIVGSAPFYVGAPAATYYDDFEAAPYGAFAATWRTRAPYLYVGANDGMLHAFDATTGAEKFAYVPNLVFRSLSALTSTPFVHRYNVDGSPVVADTFYAGAWHTLLVAGLRAGGRGVYALDVTDPTQFSEAGAASVVRWEFSDADMGHVFTPPAIVKTNNGRWSVITGNGYDNPGGDHAVLYVLDAETGEVVRKIDAGSATNNGLSGAAPVDVDGDGVVDVVYAGDLRGRLWKFDLSAASPADWSLAINGNPLFTAGFGKAITSRPDVTRTPRGGYLVTFGTGRYLSWVDPGRTFRQTIYGIWDKDDTVVSASQLQEQLIKNATATVGADTYRTSTHRVGPPLDNPIADDEPTISRDAYYASKRGWFIDLPTAGERVVADARIRGGRVIFSSIIPDNADVCRFGGSGWILEFDVFTGNRLDSATFDVDGNGSLTDADYVVFPGLGGDANNASGWRIEAIPAAPAFMGFRNGNLNSEIKYVNTSDGTVVQKREAAGTGGEGRVMWRVVQ